MLIHFPATASERKHGWCAIALWFAICCWW